MQSKKFEMAPSVCLLWILLSASLAWSTNYKVVYQFDERHAANPSSGLVADKFGNVYGTTAMGHNFGGFGGTVYQLSPTKGFSVIYDFKGFPDGADPQGNLAIDTAGNIYGTTVGGGNKGPACGANGCGTVFRLSPPLQQGDPWTETILYTFLGGNDGSTPEAGVVVDAAGNLYGTTKIGGARGVGTVFELSPGLNDVWTETVIYGMENLDGFPLGSLIFDNSGNLYGTAGAGGPGNAGTVFELIPQEDGQWTYSLLYSFDGANGSEDGKSPQAGVTMDASGNLYGTTAGGGSAGFGTVFQLAVGGGEWTETILYSFQGGNDGAIPLSSLVLDEAGCLDGTTSSGGGKNNHGTIFRLTPKTGQWIEGVFQLPDNGKLGIKPSGPLWLDGKGHAYGTTALGGIGAGLVFRIGP